MASVAGLREQPSSPPVLRPSPSARQPVTAVASSRPRLWREMLLIALVYGAYTTTRNLVPTHTEWARSNAIHLLDVERRLGIDIERAVNDAIAAPAAHALAVVANYTYGLAHFGVTLAVLLWVYLRHPAAYRPARTIALTATALAVVGYWLFPLAPPRFFPGLGYVDTIVRDRTVASWGSSAIDSISNQYAAMPSMHFGWSLWVAGVVVALARRRWVRVVAAAYPVLVFFVIVATGNHWVLDAVGGLAAVVVGAGAYLLGRRVASWLRHRRPYSLP